MLSGALKWVDAYLMMSKVSIIKDQVTSSDIFQGELGNCYLLSSISALAEYPERIQRLLLTKTDTPEHVYAVALNYCGNWKKIHLDGKFPVKRHSLAFAHTKSAEIWVMLLEKAYAKLYGGYWNIGNGGVPGLALKDLTGAPCETDRIGPDTDTEDLWSYIDICQRSRYVMVAGTKGADEKKTPEGIIQGHAYTIIALHLFHGEKVIELRNPWGNGDEWNGRWGDQDRRSWTARLRKLHNMEHPKPDGRFFMPYKDFLRFFNQYSICYYEDDYFLSSFNDELESEFIACYGVKVTRPGDYYVLLGQEDRRAFYVDGGTESECF